MSKNKLNNYINSFVKSISFDNIQTFYNDEYRGIVIGEIPFSYSSYYMSIMTSEAIKDKNNRYNLFEDNLENRITDYLSKKIINKKDDKSEDKLSEYLRAFFSRRNKTFTCILPINGYYFKNKEFKLGRQKVYCMPSSEKINREILNINAWKEEYITNKLNEISNHSLFTIINVNAKDDNSANHISQRILKGYTDCLQVINANPEDSYSFNDHIIGLPKTVKPLILSKNLKDINGSNGDKLPRLFSFEDLDSFLNKGKNDYIINVIDSIAKKISSSTQLTSFENDIWTANRFIADGLCADSNSDKFTKLMVGIEALFEVKYNGENYPSTLEQITDAILFLSVRYTDDSKDNIIKLRTLIHDLYELRSRVLHGEDSIISDRDVGILSNLSTYVLKMIIANFDKLNTSNLKNKENIKKIIRERKNIFLNKFELKNNFKPRK